MPDDTRKKKDEGKPEEAKLAEAQDASSMTGKPGTNGDEDKCQPVCVEKWPDEPLKVTAGPVTVPGTGEGGRVAVDGEVDVRNWPSEQPLEVDVKSLPDIKWPASMPVSGTVDVNWPTKPIPIAQQGTVDVNLKGSAIDSRPVGALWAVLKRRAEGASFEAYRTFIDNVLCTPQTDRPGLKGSAPKPLGVDAYQLLRVATEAYLLARTPTVRQLAAPRGAIPTAEEGKIAADIQTYLGVGNDFLPFIRRITSMFTIDTDAKHFYCGTDSIADNVLHPYFLELIWSYWHEEGMLVQAINAISLRFQNKRGPGERDPLANLEIHYLRPLANILWGYIQDEDHRLTIARRAYEYEHEYGLTLVGKAVPHLRPADRRSRFLEAFHSLLHEAAVFYERSSNLTVRADGFPLLNALREVHLVLAEGAHNQFRDLPWTARVEMLIQQWLLSRPEMNAFLGGRQAVPYAEPWMGPVDTIRRLYGWGDTPITHFRDLAVNGEQILLSVRFADWSVVNDEEEARGWAAAWRPEIQRYIHAYQSVTGVDLTSMSADKQMARQINAVPPSILLQQRMARRKAR